MAGNYTSRGNRITGSIEKAVRGARSAHVKKQSLKKQTEAAKDIVSHKARTKGEQDRATTTTKAEAMRSIIKERGTQQRKTVSHKASIAAKKKTTSKSTTTKQQTKPTKKRQVAPDKKW